VKASLRTLLAGIVDYAGTFPPARLSLEESVQRYIEYRRGEHAWMLGKLVCSLDDLPTMLTVLEPILRKDHNARVPIALVIPSDDIEHLNRLQKILSSPEAEAFFGRYAGRAEIDSLELKLSPKNVSFRHPTPGYAVVFHELPWSENGARGAERFFKEVLNLYIRGKSQGPAPVGVKLRTGGLHASAFPKAEEVAWVIAKCRDAGIPWKATAGLHHPLRHYDESIGTKMHGFLNVACAAVLADVQRLNKAAIAEILRDESIENFEFHDDGLRWKDFEATNSQIAHCRKHGFLSFGSCSFDEPLAGLRELGLL
jgi:hypothetical protein